MSAKQESLFFLFFLLIYKVDFIAVFNVKIWFSSFDISRFLIFLS